MMTVQLGTAIAAAVAAELSSRGLPVPEQLPEVALGRPGSPQHGDYASSVALQLAPLVGTSPRELATALAVRLASTSQVAGVEVAGPGFS